MSDDIPTEAPPVEPMSDVAWARVERGLMARLDSQIGGVATEPPPARRRHWAWFAVPAFAAAAAVVAVVALRGGGEQQTRPPEVAVHQPEHLDVEPSRIVTGDTPSSVSFADAHLTLEASTAIVMTREAGSPSVLVERGSVDLTVAPRKERPPFVVRAGDTVVRVVGTHFRVARYEERVSVAVEHGLVDVVFRGNTVRISAGQTWHSEDPSEVTSTSAAAEPPPVAQQPEPPKPAVMKPVQPKTGPVAVDGDRATYEKMLALEVKDPNAALAGYLALSRGSSKWAAVSLYSAARLAADRRDSRATTFLTIYLRRFPTGANAEDARTLLKRLQGETR